MRSDGPIRSLPDRTRFEASRTYGVAAPAEAQHHWKPCAPPAATNAPPCLHVPGVFAARPVSPSDRSSGQTIAADLRATGDERTCYGHGADCRLAKGMSRSSLSSGVGG